MSTNDQKISPDGAVSSPKQMLLTSVLGFVAVIFVIMGLAHYVTAANKTATGAVDMERAVAERIQKVGLVEVREANRALRTGEEVFKERCSACHGTGAAGSPKFQDAAAWAPRIGSGYAALLNSALKGKGNMGAQGGGDFSDLEVGRGVVYMANAGGARFPEPAAPADGAASAAK
jgi:cytochrome c5